MAHTHNRHALSQFMVDSPNEIIPIGFIAKDIQIEWPEYVNVKKQKIFSKHNCDDVLYHLLSGVVGVVFYQYPIDHDLHILVCLMLASVIAEA